MRSIFLSIAALLLCALGICSQTPQTDRQIDGLRDAVKTVFVERADLKKKNNQLVESNRRPQEESTYDADGNQLAWKTYDYLTGTLFESVVYRRQGAEQFVYYLAINSPSMISQKTSSGESKPDPKLPPGVLYYYRLRCTYDTTGRITEEAWHQRGGALWLRYVYKYSDAGREELSYAADGDLNSRYFYPLDERGTETGFLTYDPEKKKDVIFLKEAFEYPEIDARGNWTKRITLEVDQKGKKVAQPKKVTYRRLTYF